jgi:putative transposase
MTFPKKHCAELHSSNPIELLSGESKRRADVFGVVPNEAAVTLFVGTILIE